MIDWVDSMGASWGWQWRILLGQESHGARSWWATLIEGTTYPEGSGERLTGDALKFHRAFVTLEIRHREILANHYIDPLPVKTKAPTLGIADRTWWQRLHQAHLHVATQINENETMHNVHMHRRTPKV